LVSKILPKGYPIWKSRLASSAWSAKIKDFEPLTAAGQFNEFADAEPGA
jgi:hypothetical protein